MENSLLSKSVPLDYVSFPIHQRAEHKHPAMLYRPEHVASNAGGWIAVKHTCLSCTTKRCIDKDHYSHEAAYDTKHSCWLKNAQQVQQCKLMHPVQQNKSIQM